MRLTVGPLSPSVYWRRRAVVGAVVLVVILLIAYSCSGGDDPKKNPAANPGTTNTGVPASTPPSSQGAPVITPNASEPSSGLPINGGNQGGGVTGAGANGETCTDEEMAVVAAAESTSVRHGAATTFYIKVKNISNRQCSRDLSAQAQELYLEQNSAKQWSSDACSSSTSSGDVRRLQPASEQVFNVPWNGQETAQGCNNRQPLKPGTYQLRARLGTIISEPVTFTVTA